MASPFIVRRARASDVPAIESLVAPYVRRRILIGKERVAYYESIQEFEVAEAPGGELVGCGALHTLWEDLGEVRTLAVSESWLHHGVGHAILEQLQRDAVDLGLKRLFCLTFEVDFFAGHGFHPIGETVVSPDVYAELVRSSDEGVAEFLELARVKPNTLGNTRMLKLLDTPPAVELPS
jgi:amino-acid N-acetyltransferase